MPWQWGKVKRSLFTMACGEKLDDRWFCTCTLMEHRQAMVIQKKKCCGGLRGLLGEMARFCPSRSADRANRCAASDVTWGPGEVTRREVSDGSD